MGKINELFSHQFLIGPGFAGLGDPEMEMYTATIILVIILVVAFLIIGRKFRKVDVELSTPLVSGRLKGERISKEPVSGQAEVFNISGENIRIGNVIGVDGSAVAIGKAQVSDIAATKDVDIKDVMGTRQSKKND